MGALPILALAAFWFLPWPLALPTGAALSAAALLYYGYLLRVARRPVIAGVVVINENEGIIMKEHRSLVIAVFALSLGLAAPLHARSQGMMGGGMMGGYGPRAEPGPSKGSNPQWDEFSSYVRSNGLACMSCHAYSGRGTGPALADITRRFAGRPDSRKELARSISNGVSGQWPGYPPMPGGLATPAEATQLAGLILSLPRAE